MEVSKLKVLKKEGLIDVAEDDEFSEGAASCDVSGVWLAGVGVGKLVVEVLHQGGKRTSNLI